MYLSAFVALLVSYTVEKFHWYPCFFLTLGFTSSSSLCYHRLMLQLCFYLVNAVYSFTELLLPHLSNTEKLCVTQELRHTGYLCIAKTLLYTQTEAGRKRAATQPWRRPASIEQQWPGNEIRVPIHPIVYYSEFDADWSEYCADSFQAK